MRTQGLIMVMVVMAVVFMSPTAFALHSYYEQNGDCYVLVGDGPFRAVYALNNKAGGPVVSLWDLYHGGNIQDAYGITAAQEWDGSNAQKRLYIFAGIDTGWAAHTGTISRRVITEPDGSGVYSYAPPYIIHRYHSPGLPGDSPTTKGNHCVADYCTSLTRIFGGTCYPCSIVPSLTPGKTEHYDVPAGQWYHSLDHEVWSPYTYRTYGGWVHYVCRENVLRKYRDLKLHQINVNTSAVNPAPYPQGVAYVMTGEKSTMDQRGECVDGCITAVDDMVIPGSEPPHVDVVFSSSLKRSYLYQRQPSSSDYTLTGADANTTVVGSPGDLTTQHIGVSTKDATGDYLYTLGVNDINAWLAAASYPSTIASMTDLAVSDQWWQTGGIVYVYEQPTGLVYKFVRDETLASPTTPEIIPLATDVALPDSIGADGFGHLYLMRTELEPERPADFQGADAYQVTHRWTDFGNNDRHYEAKFRQGAYKTVYKRDYYSAVTTRIAQRISLGNNEYQRDFIVAAGLDATDPNNWVWQGDFIQLGANVQTDYLVKIGVINSPTPPEVVGNRNGLCDINGPMIGNASTGIQMADDIDEPPAPGPNLFFSGVYIFQVENAPRFDTYGINVGNLGVDVNSNGVTGNFVSTIERSTLKYFWKAYRIVDAASNTVNEKIRDDEADGTHSTSSLFADNFTTGKYRIGVKVQFAYYDYDLLAPDSRKASQSSVLTGSVIAYNTLGVQDYSYKEFTIIGGAPVATETFCSIVSGRPNATPASYTFMPTIIDTASSTAFVVPELNQAGLATWAFQIRDNIFPTGSEGPIAKMGKPLPPVPTDIVSYDPATLIWRDDDIQYTWRATLTKDGETIVSPERRFYNTTEIGGADVRYLFPVPSQPEAYDLTCLGVRLGEVSIYIIKSFYIDADGQQRAVWDRIDNYPLLFEARASCKVIVQDMTGPQAFFPTPADGGIATGVWCNHPALYGTTGEKLAQVEDPPDVYAIATMPYVAFVVADNNPFGNASNGTYLNHQDPFHHSAALDLRVRHDVEERFGRFHHSNRSGTVLTTNMKYRSNPHQNNDDTNYSVEQYDLVKTDFGGARVPWLQESDYDKALSYRLYQISLDNVGDFRSNATEADYLPFNAANNITDWVAPRFGLTTSDASLFNPSDEHGPWLSSAPIVIRDNDRPNVYFEIRDLKHNIVNRFPSNLQETLLTNWTYLSNYAGDEAERNGIESWKYSTQADMNSTIHSCFKLSVGNQVTTSLNQVGVTAQDVLEVDVPVFIKATIQDNIGTDDPGYTDFRILDLGGGDFDPPVVGDGTGDELRHMFRLPSSPSRRYKAKISVQDNARGWPTNPEDPYNTSVCDDDTRNKRNLEVEIDVYDATIDVRVIDRNQRR